MIELTLEGYDLWVAGVHDIVLRISDVSSSSKRDDARRGTRRSLLWGRRGYIGLTSSVRSFIHGDAAVGAHAGAR